MNGRGMTSTGGTSSGGGIIGGAVVSSNSNNANNNNNSINATGSRSKCDQIIAEALCKSFEIIAASRSDNNDNTSLSSKLGMEGVADRTTTQIPILSSVYGGTTRNNTNNNTASAATTTNPTGINSSSTRFNLQVSERPKIRDIITQHRQQYNNQIQNIPFRFDVYYQHPNDGGRELLERWCLDYTTSGPGSIDTFLEAEGMLTTQRQDSLLQLRHVWKRMVLWLRTLYVFTGFLPSHAFHRPTGSSDGMFSYDGGGGYTGDDLSGNNSSSNNNNNNSIRFSLYVNRDGTDDINMLTQQQGFIHNALPSGPATTPYGQLSCSVLYLPTSSIQHLIPRRQQQQQPIAMHTPVPMNTMWEHSHGPVAPNTLNHFNQQEHSQELYHQYNHLQQQPLRSQSKPIPMSFDSRTHSDNYHGHNNHYTEMMPLGSTVQKDYKRQLSAPASHAGDPRNYQRSASYSERSLQLQQQQTQQQQNQQQQQPQQYSTNSYNPKRGMMYDPSKLIPPRKPVTDLNHSQGISNPINNTVTQQRRHATNQLTSDDKVPERVMSGLSLALMMADGGTQAVAEHNHQPHHPVNSTTVTTTTTERSENNVAATNSNDTHSKNDDDVGKAYSSESRRAALHEMPPYAMEHQYSFGAIPSSPRQHHYYQTSTRSNSFDVPIASTPPVAAFLGGTPIHYGRQRTLSSTASSANTSNPSSVPNSGSLPNQGRRRTSSSSNSIGKGATEAMSALANGCMTPPFRERPLGFLQEASVEEVTGGSISQSELEQNQNAQDDNNSTRPAGFDAGLHQQLASLDLLHSSPFQLQQYEQSLLLASLPVFTGYAGASNGALGVPSGGGLDSVLSHYSNPTAGASGWAGSGLLFSHHHSPRSAAVGATSDDDSYFYEDTMPFAVDLSSSPPPFSSTANNNNLAQNNNHQTTSSSLHPSSIESSFFGGQSAALASLVQKCGPNSHRLKLFDSGTNAGGGGVDHHQQLSQFSSIHDTSSTSGYMTATMMHQSALQQEDMVSSLAEQLEDFRAFGASIHM